MSYASDNLAVLRIALGDDVGLLEVVEQTDLELTLTYASGTLRVFGAFEDPCWWWYPGFPANTVPVESELDVAAWLRSGGS